MPYTPPSIMKETKWMRQHGSSFIAQEEDFPNNKVTDLFHERTVKGYQLINIKFTGGTKIV